MSEASVCSHQDNARKGVSATAHAVAAMRAGEFLKHGDAAWFVDPYAEKLGGQVGIEYLRKRKETDTKNISDDAGLNFLSIRTRKMDEEILRAINVDGFRQICVVGAGLDSRAWRLKKTVDHSVSFFEIDFQEVFDWKLSVLTEANAVSPFEYHAVTADMSLPTWTYTLTASGFDPSKPTVWLLEGFINYLTEDEANAFLTVLSTTLSAQKSRIVATVCTNARLGNTMHRYYPADARTWLDTHGWSGSFIDIHDQGVEYGRPLPGDTFSGYIFCVVEN